MDQGPSPQVQPLRWGGYPPQYSVEVSQLSQRTTKVEMEMQALKAAMERLEKKVDKSSESVDKVQFEVRDACVRADFVRSQQSKTIEELEAKAIHTNNQIGYWNKRIDELADYTKDQMNTEIFNLKQEISKTRQEVGALQQLNTTLREVLKTLERTHFAWPQHTGGTSARGSFEA